MATSRPGPLKDLPLELFLDPDLHICSPMRNRMRTNKRPLSPGTSSLCTPAKRRILFPEGISSLSKPTKSPLSSANGRFPVAQIHDLLRSPDSPARRLDFGGANPSEVENIHVLSKPRPSPVGGSSRDVTSLRRATRTPSTRTTTPPLGSSSRAPSFPASSSLRRAFIEMDTDDHFSPRKSRVAALSRDSPVPSPVPCTDSQLRDIPAHYPGFDVHLDTHDDMKEAVEEKSEGKLKVSRDVNKENIPPRGCRSNPPTSDIYCQTSWSKLGRSPLRKSDVIEGNDNAMPTTFHVERIEEPLTPAQRSAAFLKRPSFELANLTPGLSITFKPVKKALVPHQDGAERVADEEASGVSSSLPKLAAQ